MDLQKAYIRVAASKPNIINLVESLKARFGKKPQKIMASSPAFDSKDIWGAICWMCRH